MALRWLGCCVGLGISSVCALAQNTYPVGGGLTSDVMATFVTAYQRGSFSAMVGPPQGDAYTFGPSGLIQTFPALSDKTQTFALIKPDSTATANVQQVWSGIYSYYMNAAPLASVGFPTNDTAYCPTLLSPAAVGNSCQWQEFSRDYALFVYTQSLPAGPQLLMQDPFFTYWNALGGISAFGPAVTMETQFTSAYHSSATRQQFDQGAIYNIVSGPATGQLLAVKEPIYDVYLANGGDSGTMGIPLSPEQILTNGTHVQAFERAAIQYNPATMAAVLLPAVGSVTVSVGTPVQMYPGETLPVQAALSAANGAHSGQSSRRMEFIEFERRADYGQRSICYFASSKLWNSNDNCHSGRTK